MEEYTAASVQQLTQTVLHSSLEDLLREGARKMLQAALELEVDEYIERSRVASDGQSRQAAVRNGSWSAESVSWCFASRGCMIGGKGTTSPVLFIPHIYGKPPASRR